MIPLGSVVDTYDNKFLTFLSQYFYFLKETVTISFFFFVTYVRNNQSQTTTRLRNRVSISKYRGVELRDLVEFLFRTFKLSVELTYKYTKTGELNLQESLDLHETRRKVRLLSSFVIPRSFYGANDNQMVRQVIINTET